MNPKIACAQYPVTAHRSFEAWKIHTENWVRSAAVQQADLLVFPEYGSMELVSLFSLEIQQDIKFQLIELQNIFGDFCDTFAGLARKYSVTIIAPGFPVACENRVYNRTCVFGPQGSTGFQDKFFMTRFENEEWGIHSAPKTLTVFEASWGNFGIQTCYDIEFSIGSKILCEAGAGLILVPSCTETIRGATRVHIGARARAMENQCFTAVSQTIGNAPWSPAVDINFGFAAVYSSPDNHFPEEGIIASETPQKETWLIADLDFSKLNEVRKNGQVLNFTDHQKLQYRFENEDIEVVIRRIET